MQTFPRLPNVVEPLRLGLRRVAVLLAVILATACSKGPSSSTATLAAEDPEASMFSGAAAPPLKLTDRKLSAYLAYERRMVELYARSLDAGAASASPTVANLAEAEEEARRQSGLERAELTAIEQMVREVVVKRLYGGIAPGDDSLERTKALQDKLSGPQREELSQAIAEMERTRSEFARLTEERRKYGDANVDLLIARETELTRAWKEKMAAFAPRSQR